jgi:hypothetical protein
VLSASGYVLDRALFALLFWCAVLPNLTSCVAIGRSLKWAGDRLIQIGGGAVVGFLAWIIYPVGWAGVALATFTASVWASLMQPVVVDKNGNAAGPDRLTWIIVGAAAALLLRAWAHYPMVFQRAWLLAKGTARALLGGVEKRLPELPPEAREIVP